MIDSATEAIEDDEVHATIKEFCGKQEMPTLEEVQDCFEKCKELDILSVLEQLNVMLEDVNKAMRVMLLIECYLRTTTAKDVKPKIFKSVFQENLQSLQCQKNNVKNKAKKLLLIVNAM